MKPFSIFPAKISDITVIQRLAAATWPATFEDILSPAQIEYMLDMMYSTSSLKTQIEEKEHQFILAKNEDQYTGYASIQKDYQPSVTKIHKLYVLPHFQGTGLGRAFIEYISKVAKQNGQHKIRLDVNYQNKAAQFYEYIGMVKVDECTTEIGNGYLMEDWIYELKL